MKSGLRQPGLWTYTYDQTCSCPCESIGRLPCSRLVLGRAKIRSRFPRYTIHCGRTCMGHERDFLLRNWCKGLLTSKHDQHIVRSRTAARVMASSRAGRSLGPGNQYRQSICAVAKGGASSKDIRISPLHLKFHATFHERTIPLNCMLETSAVIPR